MPKKTKKQKIIAQYRKKIKLLSKISNFSKDSSLKPKDKKNEEEKNFQPTKNNNNNKEILLNQKHFSEDLKKSLLISFLIIMIEVLLYFANFIK